jgi:hypothetical protein
MAGGIKHQPPHIIQHYAGPKWNREEIYFIKCIGENCRYPLDKKLGRLQNQSGHGRRERSCPYQVSQLTIPRPSRTHATGYTNSAILIPNVNITKNYTTNGKTSY